MSNTRQTADVRFCIGNTSAKTFTDLEERIQKRLLLETNAGGGIVSFDRLCSLVWSDNARYDSDEIAYATVRLLERDAIRAYKPSEE